ncbi:MAG: hypothetical protein ACK58Q_14535 [Chitinophagales bacterium]
MKHLLKGLSYLSTKSVENSFAKSNAGLINFEKIDYFIDLSQIRFSELSAINYLVLLIDSECKKGFVKNIFIALPNKDLTPSEAKSEKITAELKKNLAHRRSRANSFLKGVNFVGIIKELEDRYNIGVFFSENYHFRSDFSEEFFDMAFEVYIEFPSKAFGYHYLYPLSWIKLKDIDINYEQIENRFDSVLDNDRGLDYIDIQAIKNVIFSELKKNVQEHTIGKEDDKYFLFSIGLITTSIIDKYFDLDINLTDRDYLKWVKSEAIESLVEIYFGDSGGGFFNKEFIAKAVNSNKMNRQDQLKWAFERWSSRKFDEERRGTKGLYRIQRIVNSYNGIVSINTNDQVGGYRKGGFKNEVWIPGATSLNFDGSFIQIKLCPYTSVKEFNFTLQDNSTRRNWKTIYLDINRSKELVKRHLESEIIQNENVLIIFDLENLSDANDEMKIQLLNELLLLISNFSHPSGIIVYINSKLQKDTIDIEINSINEYLKNKNPESISNDKDLEEIYDPVIVISEDRTFWYGGSQNLINILNEVYENNFDKKLFDLESYKALDSQSQERLRIVLQNDNKLIHLSNSGDLELNFTNLDNHFSNIIQCRLVKLIYSFL